MAEREGFEPSVRFRAHTLSKRAPSTTRSPLREGAHYRVPGREVSMCRLEMGDLGAENRSCRKEVLRQPLGQFREQPRALAHAARPVPGRVVGGRRSRSTYCVQEGMAGLASDEGGRSGVLWMAPPSQRPDEVGRGIAWPPVRQRDRPPFRPALGIVPGPCGPQVRGRSRRTGR